MKTEEKARELASALLGEDQNQQPLIDVIMQMAKWKEKQMIADIRAWLRDICRVCDITDEHGYPIDERALFASFEKSLKGGAEC